MCWAGKRLIRLVDSFQEGGWFLMVLELVGGGDLFTASQQAI